MGALSKSQISKKESTKMKKKFLKSSKQKIKLQKQNLSDLADKEFKIIVIRMLTEARRTMHK